MRLPGFEPGSPPFSRQLCLGRVVSYR